MYAVVDTRRWFGGGRCLVGIGLEQVFGWVRAEKVLGGLRKSGLRRLVLGLRLKHKVGRKVDKSGGSAVYDSKLLNAESLYTTVVNRQKTLGA